MCRIILLNCILMILAVPVHAGFLDQVLDTVRDVSTSKGDGKSTQTSSVLSDAEIVKGLREALRVGAEQAVKSASAAGGYMDNPAIRIPLPGRLQSAANTLRSIGLGSQADAFEQSMNHAAEKAAEEALPIFTQAVKDLTFEDVQRLWKGGDTAVTDYFRQVTWQPLYDKFQPVVHASAQEVGVTQAYQALTDQPTVQNLISGTDLDLNHYISEEALNGLFKLLGEEEKKIRTDPVARTTDILKKVFSN
ncbi:MAG: DUF4197 domain-containing protein [Deltaproteobacteria bacterium]|nr:DUF4197 domain-containing protein [Deltaproteobacteria bacterium]